ncbi:polysialyltransferase family glycosyltransferase [Saxibacter everestensis]|uniref:Polysialyltransferase family glycosyltransferase n=1 Tax=Saxibacter everestensis TaxID=2909229 RepID=A0ABY8QWT9_9MICO|nr:polysialyltransferase family glycosyltransferase [Brevibacteriaceae bacterium ZFBP1038]
MIQLILASTLFQAVSVAAAIDEGLLGDADERVLLVANNSYAPELTDALHDVPGAEAVLNRYDRVVQLNETLAPQHPNDWSPRDADLSLLQRLLRTEWRLGNQPVELVLESIQVNPAIALARVFHDSLITIHSDGLMSFGPTRNPVPLSVEQRLEKLIYLELVPGLDPVLLRECRVDMVPLGPDPFRKAIGQITDALATELDRIGLPAPDGATALVVGQYLSSLGILTQDEESTLHVRMIESAVAAGSSRVVFKPHPGAPAASLEPLRAAASRLSVELSVVTLPMPAEVLMERLKPGRVVGCFSTALATARSIYGIEPIAVGTELLLERLAPYENSNRIPVTIVDALIARDKPVAGLQPLIEAVSYCMQPDNLHELQPRAEEYVSGAIGTADMRYFKRRRLQSLGLVTISRRRTLRAQLGAVRRRLIGRVPTTLARGKDIPRTRRTPQ